MQMGAIQLGLTIIVIAFIAKFAYWILALFAHVLFIPAVVIGAALVLIGFLTGNKSLGGGDKRYLP
jgi:hypothetical protein